MQKSMLFENSYSTQIFVTFKAQVYKFIEEIAPLTWECSKTKQPHSNQRSHNFLNQTRIDFKIK